MLHPLQALVEHHVIATDGETGNVRDFLFDDKTWVIHYLVVDVKRWLSRQEVILPVTAVKQVDWENKSLHLALTKEQVRESPDVDTKEPVSRQQEIAMRDYFGKLAYWVDRRSPMTSSMPTGIEYPVHTKGDLHLRSISHLEGYEVSGTDGDIGRLEGFVLDEASWHLGYLEVKAGEWLLCHSVLVPTRWVKSVSWADHRVKLHHTRKGVLGPNRGGLATSKEMT
jgi:sporulation protein YlmC with PRC-barrel domain